MSNEIDDIIINRKTKPISQKLNPCHANNLQASGLNDDAILASNCFSVSASEINRLLKRSDINTSGYAIPYPTNNGFMSNFVRIKLDAPAKPITQEDIAGIYDNEKKSAKYLSPSKSSNHLYIPTAKWPVIQDSTVPLFITEGEKKAMKACQDGYCCVGIAGIYAYLTDQKLIPDFNLINLKERDVYIVYDGDKVSKPNVAQAELRLCEELKELGANVYIVDLPEKYKLDDFLIEEGKAKFDELVKASKIVNNPDRIRSRVNLIRGGKAKPHKKKQELAKFIVADLESLGKFVVNDDKAYITFDSNNQLFEIDEKNKRLSAFMEDRYRLNITEIECQYVIEHMKSHCLNHGNKTNLFKHHYYDKTSKNLYMSKFNGMMYRIDGVKIDLLQNGTDGVLFQDESNWEPFEYLGPNSDRDYLAEYFVDPVNFNSSSDVVLSKDEQKALWLSCIYSYCFESIQPTKPLVLFLGPKGSGKSSTLKWVLNLFFGNKAMIETISKDKEQDFVAIVCSNPLAFFDNVDGSIPWLNDKLATLSTGGAISMRELYKTNSKVTYYPRPFISITARTPKFKRDDVVERLLIFNVATLEEKMPENRLNQMRLEKRNLIMTDLMNDLNIIVKALKEDTEEFKTGYRMADWAELVWKIAKIVGMGDRVPEILNKMEDAQNDFFFEDELLIEALNEFLAISGNSGKYFTARELLDKLKVLIPEIEDKYWSPQSLAQYLKNIEKNLKTEYEFKTRKVNGEPTQYSFKRLK